MHKLKTKDQYENKAKLWVRWLSLARVKLHEIKSLRGNLGAIRRIGTKMKFVRSQIKNPNF